MPPPRLYRGGPPDPTELATRAEEAAAQHRWWKEEHADILPHETRPGARQQPGHQAPNPEPDRAHIRTKETSLITTVEPRATLLLASLIRAYPDTVRTALLTAGVPVDEPIDPGTVVAELKWSTKDRKRIDIAFEAGRTVVVEAKVDAAPELDQVLGYMGVDDRSLGILMVPERARAEALRVSGGAPNVHVVTWDQILGPLQTITPIAQHMSEDIATLQSFPNTKTKQRAAWRAALTRTDLSPATGDVTSGARNWPAIDIRVKDAWVLGQIEGTRDVHAASTHQLTIGFEVHKTEYTNPAARSKMRSALLRLGDRLEAEGIEISPHRGAASKQTQHKLLDLEDHPYLARGYKDSYVGVRMPRRSTADEALKDVIAVVPLLVAISREIWGVRQSQPSAGSGDVIYADAACSPE